jgi:hypothetical protein
LVGPAQVFNEKTPLDDDAKPQDSMAKSLQDKLNWMKVGRELHSLAATRPRRQPGSNLPAPPAGQKPVCAASLAATRPCRQPGSNLPACTASLAATYPAGQLASNLAALPVWQEPLPAASLAATYPRPQPGSFADRPI